MGKQPGLIFRAEYSKVFFSMSPEISPTYDQIMQRTQRLVSGHSDVVTQLDAGVSESGNLPLPFVEITDPSVSLDQKQIMLITGGVHGSEECGRAVAMAFCEWLVTHGRSHLSTQSFIVCPCLNPDGALQNLPKTGTDRNIYTSCRIGSPDTDTVEAAVVLGLVDKYLPECCVDIHGLGGGAVGDTIYVTPGLSGNLSTAIGFDVAYEMSREAAAMGFVQRDPYMQPDYNKTEGGISWVKKTAVELNTLSFTVESSEHMLPINESASSGLCRMIRLVQIGERMQWYQPYPGYPVDILTDNGVVALMPHGNTPGERRQSRREIMTAIHEGGIWNVERDVADHATGFDRTATARMVCRKELKTVPSRFTIQMMLDRRASAQAVRFNGTELSPDPVHGFMERLDPEGRFVRIHVNHKPIPGENIAEICYRMPVEPHDPLSG